MAWAATEYRADPALIAACELVLRERFGGEIDRSVRRSRARYANDITGYFADILDAELTDQQQAIVEAVARYDRVLVQSANNVGKTWLTGGIGVWMMDAVGSAPGDDGRPQGCVLLLPGPDHATIKDTVYRWMLGHAATAERRGYRLRGAPSERSVHWFVRHDWFVRAFSPQRKVGRKVAHVASGRHHARQFAIIEEGAGVEDPIWRAVEGMCSGPGNKILACFNPTEQAGAAWERAESWSRKAGVSCTVLKLSALDHPNVRRRMVVVGGGAIGHQVVEDRIRLECIDRGPREAVQPAGQDFVYALPHEPLAEGSRDDGIPGHPDGEPRVYRPNGFFASQVLGEWPAQSSDSLFDAASWDAAVRRWQESPDPVRPPDRVGVDCAREGQDTVSTAPAWGRDAEDLYRIWREIGISTSPVGRERRLDLQGEAESWEERPQYHQRESTVDPEHAWERIRARHRVRIGELGAGPKGDGPTVARWLEATYGRIPRYTLDEGSVGASILDHASEVLGLEVLGVSFGASPRPAQEGEALCENMRTQLYVRAAWLVKQGLVDVPADAALREEVLAHRIEHDYRHVKGAATGGERRPVLRLVKKDLVKAKIGRSPDKADAFVLACFPFASDGGARGW